MREIPTPSETFYISLSAIRLGLGLFFAFDCLGVLPDLDFYLLSRPEGYAPLGKLGESLFGAVEEYAFFIWLGQFIFSLCLLLGVFPRLVSAVLWGFCHFYFQLNPYIFNGAHIFAQYLLLYLIFADTGFLSWKGRDQSFNSRLKMDVWSEFSRYLIVFHLGFIYFSSALFKLGSEIWIHGEGLHYSLSSELLSRSRLNGILIEWDVLLVFLSYLALLWQLGFPFLLLHRQSRIVALVLGVFFHFVNSELMYLEGFRVVFPLSYLCFVPDRLFRKLGSALNDLKNLSWLKFLANLKQKHLLKL